MIRPDKLWIEPEVPWILEAMRGLTHSLRQALLFITLCSRVHLAIRPHGR